MWFREPDLPARVRADYSGEMAYDGLLPFTLYSLAFPIPRAWENNYFLKKSNRIYKMDVEFWLAVDAGKSLQLALWIQMEISMPEVLTTALALL